MAPDASWNVVGIGDFNGNGSPDTLWRNATGTLIDWSMNGAKVTSSQQLTLQGNSAIPDASWTIAGTGDFNEDGKADLLWRNANGSVIDWMMNGSQITSSQGVKLNGTPAMPDASWIIAGIGDFNEDGKADV